MIWQKQIGIVGGLGPLAHIEFEQRLLAAAQQKLGHEPSDQEYPPWMVASLPQTPDRVGALLSGTESPVPFLIRSLNLLRGCDFAVIACNTAHAFLPQLKQQSPLPILSIIEETASEAVMRFGPDAKLGLLATTSALKANIYPEGFRSISTGVQFVTPLDLQGGESLQKTVMDSIFGKPAGIKCGGLRFPDIRTQIESDLLYVVDRLLEADVAAVIIGCTEVSMVLNQTISPKAPLLDPLDIAAHAAIEIAAGDRAIPE